MQAEVSGNIYSFTFGPRDQKGPIMGYRGYPKANDIGVWKCQLR